MRWRSYRRIGFWVMMAVLVGLVSSPVQGVVMDELSVVNQGVHLLQQVGFTPVSLRTLTNAALKGMVAALGDGSRYITPEEVEFQGRRGEGLIGVRLGLGEDGVVVRDVHDAGPAHQAGVQLGDVLLAVDEVTVGSDINLALQLIRGEPAQPVRLQLRAADDAVRVVEVTRTHEPTHPVGWMQRDGVGVITIGGFGADTVLEVRQALEGLARWGLHRCIIDLRDNAGGDVETAADVAALLTGEAQVGYYQDRTGRVPLLSQEPLFLPVQSWQYAVLINARTASAGELLAAALADRRGATLVGEQTTGKATVQRNHPMHNGGVLSLTIGQLYRLTGESWRDRGLVPHLPVRAARGDELVMPHRTLVVGTVGLDVLRLQRWLTECGFHPGLWNGVLDDPTLAALNRLRAHYALAPLQELTPRDVLTSVEAHRQFLEGPDDPVLIRALQLLAS